MKQRMPEDKNRRPISTRDTHRDEGQSGAELSDTGGPALGLDPGGVRKKEQSQGSLDLLDRQHEIHYRFELARGSHAGKRTQQGVVNVSRNPVGYGTRQGPPAIRPTLAPAVSDSRGGSAIRELPPEADEIVKSGSERCQAHQSECRERRKQPAVVEQVQTAHTERGVNQCTERSLGSR